MQREAIKNRQVDQELAGVSVSAEHLREDCQQEGRGRHPEFGRPVPQLAGFQRGKGKLLTHETDLVEVTRLEGEREKRRPRETVQTGSPIVARSSVGVRLSQRRKSSHVILKRDVQRREDGTRGGIEAGDFVIQDVAAL